MSIDDTLKEAKKHGAVDFYQGLLAATSALGMFSISGGVPDQLQMIVWIALLLLFLIGILLCLKPLTVRLFGIKGKIEGESSKPQLPSELGSLNDDNELGNGVPLPKSRVRQEKGR